MHIVISPIALAAALVGLLVYALAANPKVAELGRLAYFAGLLATLWALAGAFAVRL